MKKEKSNYNQEISSLCLLRKVRLVRIQALVVTCHTCLIPMTSERNRRKKRLKKLRLRCKKSLFLRELAQWHSSAQLKRFLEKIHRFLLDRLLQSHHHRTTRRWLLSRRNRHDLDTTAPWKNSPNISQTPRNLSFVLKKSRAKKRKNPLKAPTKEKVFQLILWPPTLET